MNEEQVRQMVRDEMRSQFPDLVSSFLGATVVQLRNFLTSGTVITPTLRIGNYTLPRRDGLNGEVMTTDGAGNVTFQ